MPLGRSLLLLAVLAVSVLAGCAAPPPAPTQTQAPQVITDPRDTSYLRNATPGSHAHDYWQGGDTVTVVDETHGPLSSRCTGSGCEDIGIGYFRPEESHIVPQGTAWVNVTVRLEEDAEGNSHGPAELWVKTAQDAEAKRVGPLQDGVQVTINTTNDMDDIPHYVLSLWRFEVHVLPPPGAQDVSFSGKVHLEAVAQRGLPLVVYGPHPDQWKGATEIVLLSTDQEVLLEYQEELQGGTSTTCYGGCLGQVAIDDGKIVPLDAAAVLVTVTFQPGAIPTGIGLLYHGADSWAMKAAVPEPGGLPGTLQFRLPLGETLPDSPYAHQTLWELELYLDQPTPVRAWAGQLHVEAKAVRA